jgi:hypothetical protein
VPVSVDDASGHLGLSHLELLEILRLDPARSLYQIRSVICVVLLMIRQTSDTLPQNCLPAQAAVGRELC